MIGGAANIATAVDGSQVYARPRVEDADAQAQGILPAEASPAATSALIGDMGLAPDGRASIVVAANVVGFVPPAGLMVQVQLEPKETQTTEQAAALDDRIEGAPPLGGESAAARREAAGAVEPGVRNPDELSQPDRARVNEMQARDASVRREEQAHAAAAGSMAGPIQYEYGVGPDGRRYVVNGRVPISATAPAGDPAAAERMGRKLSTAAMAAQAPSAADYSAAAEGYRVAGDAQRAAASEDRPPPQDITL